MHGNHWHWDFAKDPTDQLKAPHRPGIGKGREKDKDMEWRAWKKWR